MVNGSGQFVNFMIDQFIQNDTISDSTFVGARKIYIGHHVTDLKEQGNVMMTSGSHTLFEAKEVEFQAGVIVESGAVLEIQNPNHQHGTIFDSNNN